MMYAVLVAAGESHRTKGKDKLWTEIQGKPLLWFSLKALVDHPLIREVVVVVRPEYKERVKAYLNEWEMPQVWIAEGGATRQASVRAGVKKLGKLPKGERVLIHNAANPFVSEEEIVSVIDASEVSGAAGVGRPVVDTLRRVNEDQRVIKTLDRQGLWQMQTPQVVPVEALEKAWRCNVESTDELGLVEDFLRGPARLVLASDANRKVTTLEDLEWARFKLEGSGVRVGMGLDSHRFHRTHKGLVLGGRQFDEHPRFESNSDGDVVLHALCNALLQALGEGASLGSFADAWCQDEGITDSREYLRRVVVMVHERGFKPTQIGLQFEGSVPRIDPLAAGLKTSVAELLDLPESAVGITATSGEDLTPFGRGEGLQCWAMVTLRAA